MDLDSLVRAVKTAPSALGRIEVGPVSLVADNSASASKTKGASLASDRALQVGECGTTPAPLSHSNPERSPGLPPPDVRHVESSYV
jgi:hypothetical protein